MGVTIRDAPFFFTTVILGVGVVSGVSAGVSAGIWFGMVSSSFSCGLLAALVS
jgi:hypothetical protein